MFTIVVSDLVSSVLSQEIGWKDRLGNDEHRYSVDQSSQHGCPRVITVKKRTRQQTERLVDAVRSLWIVEDDVETEGLGSQRDGSADEICHTTT